jgi:hypothetical protein
MITESELRDALGRQAETYEVPPLDLMSLRAAAQRRRRDTRLRYGGIAAAALLAVSVAWGQLNADQGVVRPADDRTDGTISPSCIPLGESPPVPDSPWAGGAFLSDEPVPSAPPAPGDPPCTLVLHYGFHRFGNGLFLSGAAHLYSDGRLIVETATEKDWFVQWERRLTPAGAERIRATVVPMLGDPVDRPSGDLKEIHYGDDTYRPKDATTLVRHLVDLSWIPDDEWVTEDPTIYRAAWYLTCYERQRSKTMDVHAAVSNLPSDARDVLESRVWTASQALIARAPAAEEERDRYQCVVLSRAEATVLVEALGGDITAGTADVFQDPSLDGPAHRLSVHALMPDGTSGAHGD